MIVRFLSGFPILETPSRRVLGGRREGVASFTKARDDRTGAESQAVTAGAGAEEDWVLQLFYAGKMENGTHTTLSQEAKTPE